MISKVCTRCKKEKSIHLFNRDRQKKDGVYPQCKVCTNNKFKLYQTKNKNEYRIKNNLASQKMRLKDVERSNKVKTKSHLRKNFNITIEDRQVLWDKQKGCCAICGKHESMFKYRLSIEHCHETGRIRGLACFFCNVRIIGKINLKYSTPLIKYLLNSYPEIRKSITEHLERYNEDSVSESKS